MLVAEIYERLIKPLPTSERLRLIAMTAQDLAAPQEGKSNQRQRSVLEFHGLGRESGVGKDAQEYVNDLRQEWDHRP